VSSALRASESVGLSVSHLVIKYGDITAVDHVSFTAQPGRVTVILGPNGAGKTSTIEACEGFLAPTSGSVQVLGLNPFLQRKQLNRKMGIMLQEGGIYPSARVAELVRQYCSLYGNGVDADVLISRVGLQSITSTTYRRLSGGEKQRLSLALALAARPQIIFLDEPTSGIDVNGRVLFAQSSGNCEMLAAASLLLRTNLTKQNALPMMCSSSIAEMSLPLARWMNCAPGVKKFVSGQPHELTSTHFPPRLDYP